MASIAALCFADTSPDVDLWGHVRFGLDHLRSGRLARVDPYSYLTEGSPWINHEWLAELAMGLAFAAAGPTGLVLLKTLLSVATVVVIVRHLLARGVSPASAALASLLPIPTLAPGLIAFRPQAFTYLLFTVLLVMLDRGTRGDRRGLVAVPILLSVWANVHGGFLAGLGIVIGWGGLSVVEALWRSRAAPPVRLPVWIPIGVVAATALATLINPYGHELLRFLLRTATVPRPGLLEWSSIEIASKLGAVWVFLVVLAGIVIVREPSVRRLPALGILVCCAILPLAARRHLPLFGIAVGVLGGEGLANLVPWSGAAARAPASGATASRLVLVASLALAVAATPFLGGIQIAPGWSEVPARAVERLARSGVGGNIAIDFNWGEYAIWHLSPRFRVSIDGRRETVYPDAVYAENLDFLRGVGDWSRIVRRGETDLVLVGIRSRTYARLGSLPDWQLVHQDGTAALFARRGSPLSARIAATPPREIPPDGTGLWFP